MLKTMTVTLEGRSYSVYSGEGSLRKLREDLPGKYYLLADRKAYGFHADKLGIRPAGMTLVEGEGDKSLFKTGEILEDMIRVGISRSDALVTFGGGVCGDLGGFSASIFLRGIRYYQVPTTLLAQVDSSIGGKCGVNLVSGKNLAGSFHQPEGVYLNRPILDTLPADQVRCGMAEVLKTALLFQEDMVEEFEKMPLGLPKEDQILRCVNEKRIIVQKDPFDKKERMLLNFGHTLGHALEGASGYVGLTHGEAVSIGMMEITRISEARGWTRQGTHARMARLLGRHGLPVLLTSDRKTLLSFMERDKKTLGGRLHLVILEDIAKPRIVSADLGFFLEDSLWT